MTVSVLGAGAFGTALAITLAKKSGATLWARDPGDMQSSRKNTRRLPGCRLPDALTVTGDLSRAAQADCLLLAVPMQKLRGFLQDHHTHLTGKPLVACCKGWEKSTSLGPVAVIRDVMPDASPLILTGPSFAADIAIGLPTALTLACTDAVVGSELQEALTTPTLRLYRTTDTIGAELGGALKNVIAIACGTAIGAGLGESARAALMTRGFAEMQRLAAHLGAQPQTLAGLSGFGDLTLTCTSDQSRNYRRGLALGRSEAFDTGTTVEGAATAIAIDALAQRDGLDLPITNAVAAMVQDRQDMASAMRSLLTRPLKEE